MVVMELGSLSYWAWCSTIPGLKVRLCRNDSDTLQTSCFPLHGSLA